MKVYSPNADYTGVTAGVAFAKGVAEVEKSEENAGVLAWFEQRGFGMGSRKGANDVEDHDNLKGSAKPFAEMSRAELEEVALGKGILGAAAMKNKEEVIAAIEGAGGADSED